MKKLIYSLLLGVATTFGITSCDSGSVGSVISDAQVDVVMDSSFVVTGYSTPYNRIQSRTATHLIGILKAENYGELRSDFVSALMPAYNLDTVGVTAESIDSLIVLLHMDNGSYVGDSLVPMRLNFYALNKELPNPIYSDFDPTDYYSESDYLGTQVYNASALGMADTVASQLYREIRVRMPIEKAREFFNAYKANPEMLATPGAFAKYFPGIYVKNAYGSGRVMNINETLARWYYTKKITLEEGKDTIIGYNADYLATTPEVVSNNNIRLEVSQNIKDEIAAGETYIQTPAGYNTVIKFPWDEILESYRKGVNGNNLGVVNMLRFEIPATMIRSAYKLNPPSYLLLIKESELDEFFAKNKLPDNETSYFATYSVVRRSYAFTNMRAMLNKYIEKYLNTGKRVSDDDNTFVLVPIEVESELSNLGSSTVISVSPYTLSPTIVKLRLKEAKITLTYSKQSINN